MDKQIALLKEFARDYAELEQKDPENKSYGPKEKLMKLQLSLWAKTLLNLSSKAAKSLLLKHTLKVRLFDCQR